MESINQQENLLNNEHLLRPNEESKLEERDSDEQRKNTTASSPLRNNGKQLLSSLTPANDVSNENENAAHEIEEISNSSENATGGSILLKVAVFWAQL